MSNERARRRREARRHDVELTAKTKAAMDLVQRCGAESIDIRYSGSGEPDDCGPPLIWTFVAVLEHGARAGAGVAMEEAALRMAEATVDKGQCAHCGRITAVDDDPDDTFNQLLAPMFCWYVFDPELSTFRRSCEGETGRAVCGWSWKSPGGRRHLCNSPDKHDMEHRCYCGELYPS